MDVIACSDVAHLAGLLDARADINMEIDAHNLLGAPDNDVLTVIDFLSKLNLAP